MAKSNKYEYRGQMLTLEQISRSSGIKLGTLQRRVGKGLPLDAPLGIRELYRYPFRGGMHTVFEIAALTGLDAELVRHRIGRNRDLEAPKHEPDKPRSSPVLSDTMPYADDRAAKQVMRYLTAREPVMTDAEIRAEFADLGKLNDDGVRWAREWIRTEIFMHTPRGGDSLKTIGQIYGVSRERIRQIEAGAFKNFRGRSVAMGLDRQIAEELRDLDENRPDTYSDIMERNAPGDANVRGHKRKLSAA